MKKIPYYQKGLIIGLIIGALFGIYGLFSSCGFYIITSSGCYGILDGVLAILLFIPRTIAFMIFKSAGYSFCGYGCGDSFPLAHSSKMFHVMSGLIVTLIYGIIGLFIGTIVERRKMKKINNK